MKDNIMKLGFGGMLVIILIAGLMIPFITEFNDNIVDKNDNPVGQYMLHDGNKDVTVSIEDGTIFVNNYNIDENKVMIMDSGIVTLRYDSSTPTVGFYDRVNDIYTTFKTDSILNFEDGSITYTGSDGNEYSMNYEMILYPAKSGNYSVYWNSAKLNVSNGDVAYIISTGSPLFVTAYENGESSELVTPFTLNSTDKTLSDYSGTLTYNVTTSQSEDGKSWIYEGGRTVTNEEGTQLSSIMIAPNTYNTEGTMSMVVILTELMPLFIGIGGFVAMGAYLVRQKYN